MAEEDEHSLLGLDHDSSVSSTWGVRRGLAATVAVGLAVAVLLLHAPSLKVPWETKEEVVLMDSKQTSEFSSEASYRAHSERLPNAGFIRDMLRSKAKSRPKILNAVDMHWETAEGRSKLRRMIESPHLPNFTALLESAKGYEADASSKALQDLHALHEPGRRLQDGIEKSPHHLLNNDDFKYDYGISKCVIIAFQATITLGQAFLNTQTFRQACDPPVKDDYDALACGQGISTFLDNIVWFGSFIAVLPYFCGVGVDQAVPHGFCASDMMWFVGNILELIVPGFGLAAGDCEDNGDGEEDEDDNASVKAKLERLNWLKHQIQGQQDLLRQTSRKLKPRQPHSRQPSSVRKRMENANARAIKKLPSIPGLQPVSSPNQADRILLGRNLSDFDFSKVPREPLDPGEYPNLARMGESYNWLLNADPERAAVNCAWKCMMVLISGSKTFVNLWNTVHVCDKVQTPGATQLDLQACVAGPFDLVSMLAWWAMQFSFLSGSCPAAVKDGKPADHAFCTGDITEMIGGVISFGEWGAVITGDCNDEKGWAKGPGNPNEPLHPQSGISQSRLLETNSTPPDLDAIHDQIRSMIHWNAMSMK